MSILQQFNRAQRREAQKKIVGDGAKQPVVLQLVPREQWPSQPPTLLRVWRNRSFLVQEYAAPAGQVRLSVNRASLTAGGDWAAEITWDELQQLKAECGYADRWAVEVFPPAESVVNVANMRHLWLLADAPEFAWKRPALPSSKEASQPAGAMPANS
jgi:hypothetical protein